MTEAPKTKWSVSSLTTPYTLFPSYATNAAHCESASSGARTHGNPIKDSNVSHSLTISLFILKAWRRSLFRSSDVSLSEKFCKPFSAIIVFLIRFLVVLLFILGGDPSKTNTGINPALNAQDTVVIIA